MKKYCVSLSELVQQYQACLCFFLSVTLSVCLYHCLSVSLPRYILSVFLSLSLIVSGVLPCLSVSCISGRCQSIPATPFHPVAVLSQSPVGYSMYTWPTRYPGRQIEPEALA